MASAVTRFAATLAVTACLFVPFTPRAEETQWLEYDAEIVSSMPYQVSGPYALFARYHVDASRIAIELIHDEPGWNQSAFGWTAPGFALYSDERTLKIMNTRRDTVTEVHKPVRDDRPASPDQFSPRELAISEEAMLARIASYREALLGSDHSMASMDIQRDAAGRITEITWQAEDEFGEDASMQSSYEYDTDGALSRIAAHAPQVAIPMFPAPADASARAIGPHIAYRGGGRETLVDFGEFAVGSASMRLPLRIEERRKDNGAFVQAAFYDGYTLRTRAAGQAPPWETWEHARRSEAEKKHAQLLADEGYWLGAKAPTAEHTAFYESFVIPLAEIEAAHENLGYRLRTFRHAYIAAMILGDEAYLRAGFGWYLDQLASLASPGLLLHAGQECIRLLMRWGYDGVAENSMHTWRQAVNALAGDDLEHAREAYAQQAPVYFAYRFLEADPASAAATDRYQIQFHRCMVLRRLGSESRREQIASLGRAPSHWATMTANEWSRMVAGETRKAADLYAAIDRPTPVQRHMQDQLDAFQASAREGTGFVPAGTGDNAAKVR